MNKLLCAAFAALGLASAEFTPNASRTFEVMLPMRDGVKLHTRVALPRNDEGQKFTTVVDRSPYGYTGLEWMADLFLPWFATVGQDMRGTEMSEGLFTVWHQDANDSQDLGDWIVQQPWSNGEIFTFGASADGLAAFTTTQNEPTWLKAGYYIWTSSIGYEVIYPNGAYFYSLVTTWMHGTVEGEWSEVCLNQFKENEAETDWWTALSMKNHYDWVDFPSAFWAGWYDIFLVGNLAAYHGFNYESQENVRHRSKITIDPLGHCQPAAEYFPQDLIAGRTLLAVAQAYELYGIRPVARNNIKNVTFYVMSSNDEAGLAAGNFWTSLEEFPTPVMTHYYAHADGSATTTAPASGSPSDTAEFSSYVYDPTNPVPTVGGNNLDLPCGPLDQGEIDQRSDVLLFETPVFSEEMAMTGPLNAHLFVSSDAIDTDFMVRISDVYPTGEVRLLIDNAARMRWREGGLEPVYMTPGNVYEAHMTLWNTSYVVAPGHRLRFAVTSSNYPRFSANPNNGHLLADPDAGPNITATNAIYHSAKYPSHFCLPVVQKRQIPKVHNIKAEFETAYPQIDADKLLNDHPDLFEKIYNGIMKKVSPFRK